MVHIKREDNGDAGNFLIYKDGEIAGKMTYVWITDKLISIEHTKVKEAFEGKGLGGKLFNEAVGFARDNGIKIRPVCTFVLSKLKKDRSKTDVME